MATKYSLAEQISLKLYGGAPKTSSPVQMQDIILAVGQMCNALLKVEHFDALKLGENAPPNLMIATYPRVTVTTFGGKKAKCTLPAIPVGLIRNLGVWEVSLTESFDCLLIPMMAGQADLLRGQPIISDLLGQNSYELYGRELVITPDITINNNTGVYIRLLITDITTLGNYDPLPVPADMEATIVKLVYENFAPTPAPVRIVDNFAANPQTQTVR